MAFFTDMKPPPYIEFRTAFAERISHSWAWRNGNADGILLVSAKLMFRMEY
jgi:hypothetical protein